MLKKIMDYRLVVFDLDGTLYYQRALQFKMACRLLTYYLLHLNKLKELWTLYQFRKVRERWEEIEAQISEPEAMSLENRQYRYVSAKVHMSAEEVCSIVEKWIYEEPLSLLDSCKDEVLSALIERLKSEGIDTAVYSDYPVEAKLNALGINMENMFSALDEDIMSLKPDPKGLETVMDKMEARNEDVLMIGDRYSKDGMAAIHAGVDFLILERYRSKREKQYQKIEEVS